MPLFSNDRDSNYPNHYSALGDEPTQRDDLNPAATDMADNDVGKDNLAMDYTFNSKKASRCSTKIRESPSSREVGLLASEQTAAAYKGPMIPGWPVAPRKLEGFSIPLFVGDVLLILFPIAFIALGISASQLDGKTISTAGTTVERAMNLGPTVYPLIFAAIGGRCLRNLAIYIAERGTTIATLEKLLGSQSLVAAVGTAFTLRSFSLLSIGIVFLWTLSPLGGQSSLRLLYRANSTLLESGAVYYSDHNAPFSPHEYGAEMQVVPAILAASLASSQDTKALPVDLWSHPKIPRLASIEKLAMDGSNTEGEWVEIKAMTDQKYSSWAGVNVQNLRKTSSAEFEINYNYMHLSCEVLFKGGAYEVWDDLLGAELTYNPIVPFAISKTSDNFNSSIADALSMFVRVAYASNVNNKFRNDTTDCCAFEARNQSINFLYGSDFRDRNSSETLYQVYTCVPHAVTLDAQINCAGGECAATRLRYVPGSSVSTLATSCMERYTIGCLTFGTGALSTFVWYLAQALEPHVMHGGRNAFDDWIGGRNVTYANPRLHPEKEIRIAEFIPDERISERLTVILNTFYQGVVWGPQITRAGLFEKPDLSELDMNPAPAERYVNITEATFSKVIPVYRANAGWIAVLLLITTVLLLLSILNLIMAFVTLAPDLFFYASSLARENPYTKSPDGGTTLNGGKRSRLLKAMRVQIADVSPENQVGYIVMKSLDSGDDFETGRLRKGRLYW